MEKNNNKKETAGLVLVQAWVERGLADKIGRNAELNCRSRAGEIRAALRDVYGGEVDDTAFHGGEK